MNQFEAPFVDEHTGSRYTLSFWRGEPIIYQPPHLHQPILTHVSDITSEYFVAGSSCTARTIPTRLAQRVLHFKLSLDDVERAVNGNDLDAGERIVWRRWLDNENCRRGRRARIRVLNLILMHQKHNRNVHKQLAVAIAAGTVLRAMGVPVRAAPRGIADVVSDMLWLRVGCWGVATAAHRTTV